MTQSPETELAVGWDAMHPARVAAARSLLRSWHGLFGGALVSASLGFDPQRRTLIAVASFAHQDFGPHTRARFEFWAHHFGARLIAGTGASGAELANLIGRITRCPRHLLRVAGAELAEAVEKLGLGDSAPNRRADHRFAVALQVLLGADFADTYDISASGLFVKGPRAPPIGDVIALELTFSDGARFELKGRVTHVRTTPDRNRRPAGFGVEFIAPPPGLGAAVLAQVERLHAPAPPAERRERARVHLFPPSPRRRPLRVRYATAAELSREYADNISAGGLFVKTGRPLVVRTEVRLELELPDGEVIETPGTVVHVTPFGMGIQFALTLPARAKIEAFLSNVAARPMRALVVDDDAFIRRVLADELERRGFDVLTAEDGNSGLELLLNELLALDLVISDVHMPGLDGPSLLRVLREGGEARMTVVLVSGRMSPELCAQLLAAGADDVLDKGLGVGQIAERVLAALKRKDAAPAPR